MIDITASHINRFDTAVPRYTSYPTVPHWNDDQPDNEKWLSHVNKELIENPQLSLYFHLPFCEELCTYCGCNKRITKNHSVEEGYIDTLIKEF